MALLFDEAVELRGALPEFLWQKICDTWNEVKALVRSFGGDCDPTFRRDGDFVEAGESVDAASSEDGKSGE